MGLTLGYWPFLLNKFFDPSTPSMTKGRDGENGKAQVKVKVIFEAEINVGVEIVVEVTLYI